MKKLTQKKLKKLMHYCPDTGKFTRLKQRTNCTDNPKPDNGYIKHFLRGREHKAHRLAWLYVHGSFPEHHIDHINQDRSDNRIANLRDVPNSVNVKNQKLRSGNKSGHNGVFWHKTQKRWKVSISVNSKRIHIGSFFNLDAAVAARKKADVEYGYHSNHGK